MSLLDEFRQASERPATQCAVSDLLDLLDEVDATKAEALREALADMQRVTSPGIARVVSGWKIDGAPAIQPQTYQRHRKGVCCRGD